MRVYKYKNQQIGEYHTFKVDNIFQAIYASKNPKRVIGLKSDSLSEDTVAVEAMEKYKSRFHRQEMDDALRSLGVMILTDKDTADTIDLGKRYIRFNSACDCWSPIIFNNQGGGGTTTSVSIGKTNAARVRNPVPKNRMGPQQPAKPSVSSAKVPVPQTVSLTNPVSSKTALGSISTRSKAPTIRKTAPPTMFPETAAQTAKARKPAPIPVMGEFERKCQRVMRRVLRVSKALGFDIRNLNDFYEQMTLPDVNKIKAVNSSVTERLVIRNLRQRAFQLYATLEITNSPDFLERQLPCEELVNKLMELRTLTKGSIRGGAGRSTRRQSFYNEEDDEDSFDQYQEQHVDQYQEEHIDQYHEGERDGSLWRALFSGPTMREEDDDTQSQDSDYDIDRYEDMEEPHLRDLTYPEEDAKEVLVQYDEYGNEIGRSILDMRVNTYSSGEGRTPFGMSVFVKWLWAWKMCLIVAILSATVSFHIAGKLSTKYMIMYGSTNMNSIFENVNTDTGSAIMNPYQATTSITEGFNKEVRLADGMLLQFEPFAKSPHEYKNVWHDYKEYSRQVMAPPVCTIQKNAKAFKDVSHMALANEFGLINDYIEYMHTCITTNVPQSSPLKMVQERFKKQYASMFVEGVRKPTVANIVKENVFQYVVEEFAELVKSHSVKFNNDMDRLLSVKELDEDVRSRMIRFRTRVEQVRNSYKEGSTSTKMCKTEKNKDTEITVKTNLHAYTWQLMTDIFTSFHDIGKEQLITHNRYIPVIKQLIDLKMELRDLSASQETDQAKVTQKLQEILEEMTKLPQIEPFTTMMVIFESAVPNLLPNADQSELYDSDFSELLLPDVNTIRRVVNNAVSIIQGRNEHMRKTVDDYVKAYENAEYLESTFSIFGGVQEFGEMAIGQLSPVNEPIKEVAKVAFNLGSQQLTVSLGDLKTVAFELQTNIMNTLQQVQFRDTDQMHLNMLAPVVGSSFAVKSLTTFMQSSVGATTLSIIRNLENVDPGFRSLTQGMASAWNIGSSLLDTMSRDTRLANVRLFHAAIKYNYERAGIANIRNIDQKDAFYALQKSWQLFDALGKKDYANLQTGFYDVIRTVGVRTFTEWTQNYRQQTMFEMEMLSNMIMNTLLTMGASPEASFGEQSAAQLRMYDLQSIVLDGEHLFDMEKTSVEKLAVALLKRMFYMVMAESFKK